MTAPRPPAADAAPAFPAESAWSALWRVLAITAGRAAVSRGAALYGGIAIGSAILFGGNGLSARTVTRLAEHSAAFRLGLWAVWLLATLPVARALLATRASFFLRALPVPRGRIVAIHAVHLALSEAPMIALWGRGAGPLGGAWALLFGIGVHCALLAGLRRPGDVVHAALLLAAAGLGTGALGLVSLVCVLVGAPLALVAAFRRAPLLGPGASRPRIGGPPVVALGLMHSLQLVRAQRPLLVRALLLHAIGACIAVLALRNNHVTAPAALLALTRLVLVGPALLGAGAAAGPVVRSERELRWLLAMCGVSGPRRALAALLALGAVAAALGLGYGAVVGALGGPELSGLPLPSRLRLAGECAVLGAAVAAVALALVRWACRGEPRDGERTLVVMVVSFPVGLTAAWGLGPLLLPAAVLAGLILTLWAVQRAVPATRYGRILAERHARSAADPEGVQ